MAQGPDAVSAKSAAASRTTFSSPGDMEDALMAIVPPHDPQNSGSPSSNKSPGRPFFVSARVNWPPDRTAMARGLKATFVAMLLTSRDDAGVVHDANAGNKANITNVSSMARAVRTPRRSGGVTGSVPHRDLRRGSPPARWSLVTFICADQM